MLSLLKLNWRVEFSVELLRLYDDTEVVNSFFLLTVALAGLNLIGDFERERERDRERDRLCELENTSREAYESACIIGEGERLFLFLP